MLQDCSALAFLLDKLLPVNDNLVDRECSTMARMLIAALASCNHSPDAQTLLVTEVMIMAVLVLSDSVIETFQCYTLCSMYVIAKGYKEDIPPLLNIDILSCGLFVILL
jgi:hypothetical protein